MSKNIMFTFIFLFLCFGIIYSQTNTDSLYNAALKINDPKERIKALEELLTNYPDIDNAEAVRTNLFTSAIAAKDSNLALEYGLKLIKNITDVSTAYNRVAYYLAKEGFRLDSALVFIDRANEDYEKSYGKKRAPYLDTKALVHYKRGEFKQALETQKEAVSIFPKDKEWDQNYSEYYYYLSLYMYKNGFKEDGLRLMARTSFFGVEDATKMLKKILEDEKLAHDKVNIYESAANEYLKAVDDVNIARSVVALGWAKQNILLDKALEYAQASINAITKNTSFDEQSNRYTTLGIVNFIMGDNEKGITDLLEAKKYASPYNTDLYLYLGKAFESKGDKQKAFEVYLSGVTGYKPSELMEKLQRLHPELYPNGPELDELIKNEIEKIENFKVEHFIKPKNVNKNVLAELFTGSECRPCLAADIAYDKLIERYDLNTLSVLEYHLHIPAPDPLTNYDTEERAKFYGVNSTPTSIIEGTERSISGGPRAAAKNRFDIYSATIEKHLLENSKATIETKVSLKDRKITIESEAFVTDGDLKILRFYLVLAEEKVHYKGYNTVSEHRFVVRKILPTPEGMPFENNNRITYKTELITKVLEEELLNYADEFEKKAGKKVFKERKYNVKDKDLYLVAFVQNIETKEILQSHAKKISR